MDRKMKAWFLAILMTLSLSSCKSSKDDDYVQEYSAPVKEESSVNVSSYHDEKSLDVEYNKDDLYLLKSFDVFEGRYKYQVFSCDYTIYDENNEFSLCAVSSFFPETSDMSVNSKQIKNRYASVTGEAVYLTLCVEANDNYSLDKTYCHTKLIDGSLTSENISRFSFSEETSRKSLYTYNNHTYNSYLDIDMHIYDFNSEEALSLVGDNEMYTVSQIKKIEEKLNRQDNVVKKRSILKEIR